MTNLHQRESLGIFHALSALNIDHQQALRVGQMSANDPSAGGNPITFIAGQYQRIFEAALDGRLELLSGGA